MGSYPEADIPCPASYLNHFQIARKRPDSRFCGYCARKLPNMIETEQYFNGSIPTETIDLTGSPERVLPPNTSTARSTLPALHIPTRNSPTVPDYYRSVEKAIQTRTISAAQNRDRKNEEDLPAKISLSLYKGEYMIDTADELGTLRLLKSPTLHKQYGGAVEFSRTQQFGSHTELLYAIVAKFVQREDEEHIRSLPWKLKIINTNAPSITSTCDYAENVHETTKLSDLLEKTGIKMIKDTFPIVLLWAHIIPPKEKKPSALRKPTINEEKVKVEQGIYNLSLISTIISYNSNIYINIGPPLRKRASSNTLTKQASTKRVKPEQVLPIDQQQPGLKQEQEFPELDQPLATHLKNDIQLCSPLSEAESQISMPSKDGSNLDLASEGLRTQEKAETQSHEVEQTSPKGISTRKVRKPKKIWEPEP